LKLRVVNTFADIRKLCLTIPSLSYITNYDLVIENTNTVCDDSDPIANHQLQDFDIIKMVPTMYSRSSAKNHVEVLKYILNDNPPFINKFTEKSQILYKDLESLIANAKEDNEKAKQFVKDYCDEINGRVNYNEKPKEDREKGDKESNDPKENTEPSKETQDLDSKKETKGPTSTNTSTVKENEEKNKVDPKSTVTNTETTSTNVNTNSEKSDKQKSEVELLADEEKIKKEFKEKIEVGLKNMKEIREKVTICQLSFFIKI